MRDEKEKEQNTPGTKQETKIESAKPGRIS
jgi:hypothetical protein